MKPNAGRALWKKQHNSGWFRYDPRRISNRGAMFEEHGPVTVFMPVTPEIKIGVGIDSLIYPAEGKRRRPSTQFVRFYNGHPDNGGRLVCEAYIEPPGNGVAWSDSDQRSISVLDCSDFSYPCADDDGEQSLAELRWPNYYQSIMRATPRLHPEKEIVNLTLSDAIKKHWKKRKAKNV